MPVHDRSAGGGAKLMAAAALALAAAGCLPRNDFTSGIPTDYRQRHAIGLTQANETLDVFVATHGGRLDRRQIEDVQAFGRDYMQNGQGPLVAYMPVGGHAGAAGPGLESIRRALAGGGASGRLQVAQYPAQAGAAAPIKLAFAKLKAETATVCGYQDEEMPAAGLAANAANREPFNFGCSYQKNLAAQIADPRDLVRPRQEGPIDVDKRLAGIERSRETDQKRIEPVSSSIRKMIPE
jgi:pilus assembly protein CpaD